MSKFTKELVDSYADKLLIGLTEEENNLVLSEFDIIDKNMEIISEFPNIQDVEPMTFALDDFVYTPRSDIAESGVEIDKLLQNCDYHEGREVEVPKVVGNE